MKHLHKDSFAFNFFIATALLFSATLFSSALTEVSDNLSNVSAIYILAIFLIAQQTEGYFTGLISSLIAVFLVNFAFTYPYMELNFSMEGYPITFLSMAIISGVTSTLTTKVKKQNKALHEREKLLMEAEKEKMRANLLRAISHDLRTPLTSIMGTSSAYLENQTVLSEEEKSALLKTIYDDSNWLLNMVENLLSVTRIKNNSTQVSKSPEVLEEVVSEAVAKFRKRFPNTAVLVSIPDDFILLPMDAILIEQVIINLLENAARHGKSTKPIEFSVALKAKEALFTIKDYGTGIPESSLHTLFDGCTLSADSSADGYKGMGIGLSICKTIIKAHGGDIFAKNHDCGAVFTFYLPLEGENYES